VIQAPEFITLVLMQVPTMWGSKTSRSYGSCGIQPPDLVWVASGSAPSLGLHLYLNPRMKWLQCLLHHLGQMWQFGRTLSS
jgi:hypothetical protein